MEKIIYKEDKKVAKDENIKEIRKDLLEQLKEEKITLSEWQDRIVNYINQKYEECTLQ